MIEIISPAGFEGFFRELADLAAAGPPAFDRVAALASFKDSTRNPARACSWRTRYPRDRDMVGGLVGGEHSEGNVLDTSSLDLAGGAHVQAAAVQQRAQ